MEIIVPWLGIALLILLVTGPFAASMFIKLIKRNNPRWLWIFSLGLGLISILEGLFIAHTFSDFFPGIGCFVTILTPIVATGTFLGFRFRAKRVQESFVTHSPQRQWFQIGTFLIPLLQLFAPVVGFGYARTCDALNQQAAAPVIAALRDYRAETGSYPVLDSPYQSSLTMLVPRYLSSLPPRACVVPLFNTPDPYYPVADDWSLYYCSNTPSHETLLMVPILGSDSQQIYNLTTEHWLTGNAFDGYCSYLR